MGSTTGFVTTDGGRIAYGVEGAGPLVVLSPGMGDLRASYRFQVPAVVGAGYRAVSVDLRGHGEATPPLLPTETRRPATTWPRSSNTSTARQ